MQSILTNTLIAAIGRVVNIGLAVLLLAMVARWLGPQEFGLYVLVLSFGTILQLGADFGLYLTLTQDIATQPGHMGAIITNIVSLRVVLLVAAFLAGWMIVLALPSFANLSLAYIIVFIGLMAQSISQLLMGVYQYQQSVWRATAGDLIGRIIQIILVVWFSYYVVTINNVALSFTVSAFIALLIHVWLLPQRQKPRAKVSTGSPSLLWHQVIDWTKWKKIIIVSWPLGAMLILNAIYFRVDMLVLSLFRFNVELGWYGVAYRIIENTLFFPAMLGGLLLPRLSESLAEGREETAGQYIQEGFVVLFPMAALMLVLILEFGEGIIWLVAGSEYLEAAPLLSILGYAGVIMFIGNLLGFALVALKQQIFLLKLYAFLVLFNLVSNLLLVPYYGAAAAAWTTVATEGLSMSLAAWQVLRRLPLFLPYYFMGRVILISIMTGLAVNILSDNITWPIKMFAATAFFIMMMVVSRTLTWSTLVRLKEVSAV